MTSIATRQFFVSAGLIIWILACSGAAQAQFEPPATYYNTATGTGTTLKQNLNALVSGLVPEFPITVLSYDSARASLQITDEDPADPNDPNDLNDSYRMLSVYDRVSIPVSSISHPDSSIPGWDLGGTWNREHTWPRSRGVGESGPDNSDLHQLRPSSSGTNGERGNRNFGGEYGAQEFGVVIEEINATNIEFFYPGDADAGMIARQEFFMAVRYDGTVANTLNLELGPNDPPSTVPNDPPPQLGNLNRLIEWHFQAPPDYFELRRNDMIFDNYQHNRNPFVDRPEYMWTIFVDQMNDTQITIAGGTSTGNGGTTRNVDLGRVFVGSAIPAAQNFTINETGNDGTYYEVTKSEGASSNVLGRYNAFAMNTVGTKAITVGLDPDTDTSSAGLRSETVTVNNLDLTTSGGAGKGVNDANDVFNVSLTVLDHATPSFSDASEVASIIYDFGSVTVGSLDPIYMFDIFNFETTMNFTADLDFDSFMVTGDTAAFASDFAGAAGSLTLDGGDSQGFEVSLDTASVGSFSATYTLTFSDEDLTGAQSSQLTLTVMGEVMAEVLVGDYNGDGKVSAADFTVWRDSQGASTLQNRDPDNSGPVDADDFESWKENYGAVDGMGAGAAIAAAAVPEPATFWVTIAGLLALSCNRSITRRARFAA